MSGTERPRKPYFECSDCGHTEEVPMGEQFVNPQFRSCENCGESGLEVIR